MTEKISSIMAGLAHDKWDRSRGFFEPGKCEADAFITMVALGLRVEARQDGRVYVWKDEELVWNSFAVHGDRVDELLAATRHGVHMAVEALISRESVGGA